MTMNLSMNSMGHAVPKVGVGAKDHEAWEEGEVVARSHVLVVMVQDHGEEVVGSDGQRFPETHQSDCDHNSHHRNHPVNTKHYYYVKPVTFSAIPIYNTGTYNWM
jgi:hypothetical protein